MSRIRDAGDSALLLEFDARIDPRINARAVAVAAALRAGNHPGVRDVVSTYRSVAVYFDPLRADRERLREALGRGLEAPVEVVLGTTIEVPVAYGGDEGPDLAGVAAWAGLSPDEVVLRHADVPYRVFMLGFLPGFPYLGTVDARIAAPRRDTPRPRVAAGSVGVAGRQTGIYPRESPGGWQIIGRTALRVFDPVRSPAALFHPGDTVRFVPRATSIGARVAVSVAPAREATGPPQPGARVATVLRPGLFTTVQDEGRWGHQGSGVPVSGPLDRLSHRAANVAVGNAADAATLEVTIVGPEIRVEQSTCVAIAGADLQASVDGVAIEPCAATTCRPGSVLRFGGRRSGARGYIAFDGGVDVPRVLGSRATHVGAALGGVDGRALVSGDRLSLGEPRGTVARHEDRRVGAAGGGARLRVLAGPQDEFFPAAAFDVLERARFLVTPRSDRMGYRLSGASLPRIADLEMISDAAFTGGIQVPPSGEPILLMHDRQTTGGYPQIATVITADLPAAGQLAPGDWVEFERCTLSEAIAALVAQEAPGAVE